MEKILWVSKRRLLRVNGRGLNDDKLRGRF